MWSVKEREQPRAHLGVWSRQLGECRRPCTEGARLACGDEEPFVHSGISEILKPEWAAALLRETLPRSELEVPGDTAEDSCRFRGQGCSPRKNSQGTSL